jgi:hypothetical protein
MANLDFVLGVFRPDPKALRATLTTAKQKDGDRAKDLSFTLERLVLGQDEDGDELSSLVAKYVDIAEDVLEAFRGTKYTPVLLKILEDDNIASLDELVISAGEIIKEDRSVVRQGVRRALAAMSKAGLINERGGLWRMVGK